MASSAHPNMHTDCCKGGEACACTTRKDGAAGAGPLKGDTAVGPGPKADGSRGPGPA